MTLFRATPSGLKHSDDFDWLVYGGDDGSVLVYRPIPKKWKKYHWVRLKQTKTIDHGYWSVSIAGQSKRFWKTYAQEIVLTAFERPRPNSDHVAMHLDGNTDHNRRGNLRWGVQKQNQEDRKHHYAMRDSIQEMLVKCSITLNCQPTNWTGAFSHPNLPTTLKATGTAPSHIVHKLITKFINTGVTEEKMRKGFIGLVRDGVRFPEDHKCLSETTIKWHGLTFYSELIRE